MKNKRKKKKLPLPTPLLFKPIAIIILLSIVCMMGLPLRSQNINLNGFISEDALWHYRHIKEVVDYGHRLNPDIYEFASLKRPMTYPPLFHYLAASSYNLFKKNNFSLIKFAHYFNLIESILYILLIYGLSAVITKDKLFSLIGAMAAAFSFGFIVRARCGELMPFVPSDLFALAAILILLRTLQHSLNAWEINPAQPPNTQKLILSKKTIFGSLLSGILLGLSALCWNGTILIYLPLVLLLFLSFILAKRKFYIEFLKLLLFCCITCLIICLPWYIPIALKYGFNPHSAEMNWFMKSSTVMHQVKPLGYYFLISGISIVFIPIIFLRCLFKRNAINIFILFWIILAVIASYTGFRGYIAVVPIISTIALSMGAS